MLKDLQIKDIYLGRSSSWLSGLPGTKDPVPAPENCRAELAELRDLCEKICESKKREDFPVRHKDITYRAAILESLSDRVFVLRRMPDVVPPPEELNIHPNYVKHLTAPGISGLVIVAGPFGQGKTTTASSIISARLRVYGGVGITIEDPPEMPLEGTHGDGVCYQTWVEQGGFSDACRKAARWAPSMIFIGEVRDAETAAEALRASINGRLVLCTIHADNAPGAIERMYALAQSAIGNADDAAGLLANGLLCVMHQRLVGEPKHPKFEFLWLGESDSQGIRNTIRQRRFEQIVNEINLQLNRLLMSARAPQPQSHSPAADEDRRSFARR